MRIAADSNVLLRATLRDDPQEGLAAAAALRRAEAVVVSLPTLCEFVWVLLRGYRRTPAEIAAALRALTGTAKVEVDRPAVEAGIALLEAGGDFADGVIAFEGRRLGAESFVTFDRRAADLLSAQGVSVALLTRAGGPQSS